MANTNKSWPNKKTKTEPKLAEQKSGTNSGGDTSNAKSHGGTKKKTETKKNQNCWNKNAEQK